MCECKWIEENEFRKIEKDVWERVTQTQKKYTCPQCKETKSMNSLNDPQGVCLDCEAKNIVEQEEFENSIPSTNDQDETGELPDIDYDVWILIGEANGWL